MIDLEIKDYERTVEGLSCQVKEKDEEVKRLNMSLLDEQNTRKALQGQLKLLDDQIEEEQIRAENHKVNIATYSKYSHFLITLKSRQT